MRLHPYRGILISAALAALTFAVLIAFVFATGSTFGQRCDRAFPEDPARAELCVYNLSHGLRP